MTLDQWMKEQQTSPEKVATEIGTTGEAVRRYRTGARMPEPETIEKIVTVTNGAVTVQDLHDTRLAYLRSTRDGEAA